MGELIPLHNPLDYFKVLKRIQKFWQKGDVEVRAYAQMRLSQRGLSVADIGSIIKSGTVREHHDKGTIWRYTVRGRSVDGDVGECVVEINGHLVIVTIFLIEQRRKRGKSL